MNLKRKRKIFIFLMFFIPFVFSGFSCAPPEDTYTVKITQNLGQDGNEPVEIPDYSQLPDPVLEKVRQGQINASRQYVTAPCIEDGIRVAIVDGEDTMPDHYGDIIILEDSNSDIPGTQTKLQIWTQPGFGIQIWPPMSNVLYGYVHDQGNRTTDGKFEVEIDVPSNSFQTYKIIGGEGACPVFINVGTYRVW